MPEGTLGMEEMNLIFDVTDALGIDRESIIVPLEMEDPGGVKRSPNGELEVVAPASVPMEEWLPTLKRDLEELGFHEIEDSE